MKARTGPAVPVLPGATEPQAPEAPEAPDDSADEAGDEAVSALARRRQLLRRGLIAAGVVVLAALLVVLVSTVGIDGLVEKILTLPPWLVLAVVFLLPALEASAFVGVVFPGEIAVLLGGVSASRGTVSLAEVLIAASLGAVAGDQVGYAVGHRYGEGLLRRIPDRLLDDDKLRSAQAFIRRMGAKGVILGRWTAALRALVPGLAGMSQMHYARFLAANLVGGVVWAVVVGVVGYEAGDQWPAVQRTVGNASYALLAVLALAFLVLHLVRRRRHRQAEERDTPGE